jgi:hypothetical protein
MAGKAEFTEAEWRKLEKGATRSSLLVSVADANVLDSFKDTDALAGHLNEDCRSARPGPIITTG